MESQFSYQGSELELFAQAKNWNEYLSSFTKFYVQGSVLEVGAGQGNKTSFFLTERVSSWLCLEPDKLLAEALKKKLKEEERVAVYQGNTKTLIEKNSSELFDTILYLDVLEHIGDDKEEISRALSLLKVNGHLIVISPAHQFLFSPFDQAIGHFRRYQKESLRSLIDLEKLSEEELFYVDFWGLFLSLANKLFFKKSIPLLRDVLLWDRFLIPLSRWTDSFLLYSLGKSIIGVWKKNSL